MRTLDHFTALLSAAGIIATCLYWATDIIRARHVYGNEIALRLGEGPFIVVNQAAIPLDLQLFSLADHGFSIDGDQTSLMFSSQQSINGRQQHTLKLTAAPGRGEYRVVSGQEVTLTFQNTLSISVYTFPYSEEAARDAIRLPAGIIASILFLLTFVYGKRWLRGAR